MDERRQRLSNARLYLVCDVVAEDFLVRALRGGVDVVQLRSKHRRDDEVIAAGRRFVHHCGEQNALMIINDRPDLVDEIGADGVHVGQDDTPVEQARARVGPDRLVGLSTHSSEQIERANTLEVDYIAVGPIHVTPTEPDRPPVGLELVRYAAAHARHPFFVIGGINLGNASTVAAAGGGRIAVVRALTDVDEPAAIAQALRRALQSAHEEGAAGGPT